MDTSHNHKRVAIYCRVASGSPKDVRPINISFAGVPYNRGLMAMLSTLMMAVAGTLLIVRRLLR
jgi:hypothetical protein